METEKCQCTKCNCVFDSYEQLEKHIEIVHAHHCPDCLQLTSNDGWRCEPCWTAYKNNLKNVRE